MSKTKKYLQQALEQIGFSQKESEVYLTIIRRGITNAASVATALGFPKTSTREILDDLARRGLIARHKKKNTHYYSADVTRLHDAITKQKSLAEEREKIIQDVLPELQKIEGIGSKRPQIEYLEGEKALEEAFEDFLRVKPKEVLGYATFEWNLRGELAKFFAQFYKRRTKARIPWRGLIPALAKSLQESQKRDAEELRETVYVPPEYYSSIEVNVYGNNVSIVSFKEKFLVRVRSREVAQAFRHILNLAVKGSKEYNETIREEIKRKGLKQYLKEHKAEIERVLQEEG